MRYEFQALRRSVGNLRLATKSEAERGFIKESGHKIGHSSSPLDGNAERNSGEGTIT